MLNHFHHLCCRKAEEAAKAAVIEEAEAAEKARLEQDVAAASLVPLPAVEDSPGIGELEDDVVQLDPLPQLPLPPALPSQGGLTHNSLEVNLSGSVARDLGALADAVEAVGESEEAGALSMGGSLESSSLEALALANEGVQAAGAAMQQQQLQPGAADGAWERWVV